MKVSAVASLCLAPLALAKSVNNAYPQRRGQHSSNVKDSRSLPIVGANSVIGNPNDIFNTGLRGFGLQQNAISEVIILWFNVGGGAATTIVNTVTETVVAGGGGGNAVNTGLPPPPGLATSVGGGQQVGAPSPTQGVGGGTGTVGGGAGTTHAVTVGGPAGGLTFQPAEIAAAIGDMVVFTFLSANHTATQSAFDTPCQPLAGGMDSSFQPNPNNSVNPPPQVAMQVMVDTPLWFFCKQGGHCGKGMTFSINPTAAKTQAMFQAMAIAQNGQGSGSAITGNGGGAAAGGAAAGGAAAGSAAAGGAASAGGLTATVGGGAGSATIGNGAAATNGIATGTGTVNPDGSCSCAVVCNAGSFPAVAQGNGAFGGFAGAIPATMIGAA